MPTAAMIISPQAREAPGVGARGTSLPGRLDELISQLHEANRAEHPAIYRRYESELLE